MYSRYLQTQNYRLWSLSNLICIVVLTPSLPLQWVLKAIILPLIALCGQQMPFQKGWVQYPVGPWILEILSSRSSYNPRTLTDPGPDPIRATLPGPQPDPLPPHRVYLCSCHLFLLLPFNKSYSCFPFLSVLLSSILGAPRIWTQLSWDPTAPLDN